MQREIISKQYISAIRLERDAVPSFEKYPFSLASVHHLDSLKLHPAVTYFVGENGTGKSTLLEAIAISWGFNPEGGSKSFRFSTRESHSDLHKFIRLAKGVRRPTDGFFFRAESFFNVASEIERLDTEPMGGRRVIDSYGHRSLHEQSHGEAFWALVTNRFRGEGLYILDEPEAALSPQRQLAVLARIHDLVLQDSQFIIATHSPILMSYPDAFIYHFSEDGIKRLEYEETEHYQVMRAFLADPKRMHKVLFDAARDTQGKRPRGRT